MNRAKKKGGPMTFGPDCSTMCPLSKTLTMFTLFKVSVWRAVLDILHQMCHWSPSNMSFMVLVSSAGKVLDYESFLFD